MTEPQSAKAFLAACAVDPAVFELRPDYRAPLLVVDGLDPGAGSSLADELIDRAEAHARALLAASSVDVYNAVSMLHQIPLGVEDFHRYEGPARPARDVGEETFDTVADSELTAAADALVQAPPAVGSEVRVSRRLVGAP